MTSGTKVLSATVVGVLALLSALAISGNLPFCPFGCEQTAVAGTLDDAKGHDCTKDCDHKDCDHKAKAADAATDAKGHDCSKDCPHKAAASDAKDGGCPHAKASADSKEQI